MVGADHEDTLGISATIWRCFAGGSVGLIFESRHEF